MSLSFDPKSVALPSGHFIGGEYIGGAGAITVHAPSDGRLLADIPLADVEVVDRAVESAKKALVASGWATQRPRERLKALYAWADLIEKEAEALARIEAVSSSRLVKEALSGDVMIAAEQIRFFAEFADKECDDLVPTADNQFGFIASEPYGVVGAITAWNVPVALAGWKLAPALAAGNAVVLKPSEMTPFSTLYLAELAVRAGIPAGLINIVLGNGPQTGAAIVAHPQIAKISFTGSTRAGVAIMENAARNGIKPVTLELGGKSPQVVFADADLDLAAGCITRTILGNAGQGCVAGSRVLAERSIAEELTVRIARLMEDIRPGPTWDEATTFSPIISETQLSRIDGIVQAARQGGADIVCGGGRIEREGSFYQPTIITGVNETSPAVAEEIFGPVLTVQSFDDESQATEMAKHATYGLSSGLFTRDLSRAMRMIRKLEAGTVWVNRYGRTRDHILPTGGWKASGLGKDLGREAYHANRRTKSVLIDY
ncbi:aldehyde dehydrogenase family protein [Rhizobium sp. CNPSo 3490]|uniref:aldehyde dehydrogenase family protein n=1 Tax=Rhizobium sp. CNPSo 3490 TaxID=3021407 RepID=UPI00254F2CD4|nr:aldehyde dehydrogenase family protein [Rhizobium sp. CNPSo 3490]MDK4734889.1 aldehyde dehydrogenase family protein [Rhizobium sp. CNPSo 3490]